VLAFQLEGEVVRKMAALMVSSQEPQRVGIVDLERPKVEDTFYAEVAPIDVVSEEKVTGLGRVAADLKQLHQVIVLTVNVAADSDGGVHLEEVRFGPQDL
jgi:hypothetical protein